MTKPRGRSVLVALAILLLVALASCTAGGAQVPEVTNGDTVLIEGRELYIRNCAQCHGAAGDGGRGPQLSDGRVFDRFPDLADQVAMVGEGRNNMPAFDGKFSEDQLVAVVRFTREVLSSEG